MPTSPPTLTQYITQTRRLVKDTNGLFYSDSELTDYINLARSQIASMSGCIRILVPGTAPFGGGAVPGSMIPGGATPGSSTTTFNTINGVEKYSYEYANAYVKKQNQNVKGIADVITVSVSWGGIRPTLDWLPWEDLQAYARSYNVGVTSYPFYWSTYGDGLRGQVWLFPIPTAALEMEWDCICVPTDIYADSDYEALPETFTNYVSFYAAHLAYLGAQLYPQANVMLSLFEKNSGLARASSDRGKTPSFYDGNYRSMP